MTINIMDLLKSQLDGQIAGQLGKQFGESEKATQSGISALIPTILGGLLKQVSAPGGAEKLDKTLTEGGFDGGLLDNLSGMLTGGGKDSPAGKGGDLVSMIFGDKAAILGPILAKLTGLKVESISSLLPILLPVIMSFLGKQKKTMGLDANGLASMLMSQKDNISAALPPGISDAMGLGALGIAGNAASQAVASARPSASQPAAPSGGLAKVLVPLAILAAVGFGAYQYIFSGILPPGAAGNKVVGISELSEMMDIEEGAETAAASIDSEVKKVEDTVDEVATSSMGSIALPAMGEMPDLSSMFGSMKGSLEKITDAESAKAALPNLETMQQKLESVTTGFSVMPEAMKGKLSEVVKGIMPDLQAMIDKVMAIPGVKEILQPIIDKVLASTKALTA